MARRAFPGREVAPVRRPARRQQWADRIAADEARRISFHAEQPAPNADAFSAVQALHGTVANHALLQPKASRWESRVERDRARRSRLRQLTQSAPHAGVVASGVNDTTVAPAAEHRTSIVYSAPTVYSVSGESMQGQGLHQAHVADDDVADDGLEHHHGDDGPDDDPDDDPGHPPVDPAVALLATMKASMGAAAPSLDDVRAMLARSAGSSEGRTTTAAATSTPSKADVKPATRPSMAALLAAVSTGDDDDDGDDDDCAFSSGEDSSSEEDVATAAHASSSKLFASASATASPLKLGGVPTTRRCSAPPATGTASSPRLVIQPTRSPSVYATIEGNTASLPLATSGLESPAASTSSSSSSSSSPTSSAASSQSSSPHVARRHGARASQSPTPSPSLQPSLGRLRHGPRRRLSLAPQPVSPVVPEAAMRRRISLHAAAPCLALCYDDTDDEGVMDDDDHMEDASTSHLIRGQHDEGMDDDDHPWSLLELMPTPLLVAIVRRLPCREQLSLAQTCRDMACFVLSDPTLQLYHRSRFKRHYKPLWQFIRSYDQMQVSRAALPGAKSELLFCLGCDHIDWRFATAWRRKQGRRPLSEATRARWWQLLSNHCFVWWREGLGGWIPRRWTPRLSPSASQSPGRTMMEQWVHWNPERLRSLLYRTRVDRFQRDPTGANVQAKFTLNGGDLVLRVHQETECNSTRWKQSRRMTFICDLGQADMRSTARLAVQQGTVAPPPVHGISSDNRRAFDLFVDRLGLSVEDGIQWVSLLVEHCSASFERYWSGCWIHL